METVSYMLQSAVEIDDIDQLILPPDNGFSIIWLDISERPDLSILAAREAPDFGYAICTWFYSRPGARNMIIGLRIELRQPRLLLHLAIKPERYYDQLATMAAYGNLWIVPGPPPDHLRGTMEMDSTTFTQAVINQVGAGLFLTLEPHLVQELRTQLTEWKRAH